METADTELRLTGGDFNTILDPEKDKKSDASGQHYNVQASDFLNKYMEQEALVDPWRIQHPESTVYTWHRMRPEPTFSRLDFWLVSAAHFQMIRKSEIIPSYLSDHSPVVITIDILENERGKGYWKFNDAHLENEEFIQQVTEIIESHKIEQRDQDPAMSWEFFFFKYSSIKNHRIFLK